jgi:hypothetical protein
MALGLVLSACVQSASITKLVGGSHPCGILGAVAQLGERLICIQEAAGSIPTSSTTLSRSGAENRANALGAVRSRKKRRCGVFQPRSRSNVGL